jgi:hypothetical protein
VRWVFCFVLMTCALGCAPRSGAPVTPTSGTTVPIMGAARINGQQLAAWFDGRQPRPRGIYSASVALEVLAAYFIAEGAAEGVAGDVAFIQSIVETGWFRFGGVIPPSANNFAGLGATGTNSSPTAFPDAHTGVRAQIQHLRAYADPSAVTCTIPPLHHPCVDPRFALVVPKGRARTWNQMGNGNWAASADYATTILSLYEEARAFTATTSVATQASTGAAGSALRP